MSSCAYLQLSQTDKTYESPKTESQHADANNSINKKNNNRKPAFFIVTPVIGNVASSQPVQNISSNVSDTLSDTAKPVARNLQKMIEDPAQKLQKFAADSMEPIAEGMEQIVQAFSDDDSNGNTAYAETSNPDNTTYADAQPKSDFSDDELEELNEITPDFLKLFTSCIEKLFYSEFKVKPGCPNKISLKNYCQVYKRKLDATTRQRCHALVKSLTKKP